MQRVLNGRYVLLEEVARGGMGAVWRAADRVIDREVAVKLIPLSADAEEQRVLVAEARAAGAVSSPFVAALFDCGRDAYDGYVVMELVRGRSLARLLAEEQPPDLRRVLTWTDQICAGLDAAHARGVVHRDIKPANVMITHEDQVKIVDFGIARNVGHVHTRMAALVDTDGPGSRFGTPAYMAPEQINGEPADARTDLYSLGCLVFQMLTGDTPFGRGTLLELMMRHVRTPPPTLAQHGRPLPQEWEDLVADLLAKDRRDRPADADAVRRRLSRIAVGMHGVAPADARTRPVPPPARTLRETARVRRSGLAEAVPWFRWVENQPAPTGDDHRGTCCDPLRSLGCLGDPAFNRTIGDRSRIMGRAADGTPFAAVGRGLSAVRKGQPTRAIVDAIASVAVTAARRWNRLAEECPALQPVRGLAMTRYGPTDSRLSCLWSIHDVPDGAMADSGWPWPLGRPFHDNHRGTPPSVPPRSVPGGIRMALTLLDAVAAVNDAGLPGIAATPTTLLPGSGPGRDEFRLLGLPVEAADLPDEAFDDLVYTVPPLLGCWRRGEDILRGPNPTAPADRSVWAYIARENDNTLLLHQVGALLYLWVEAPTVADLPGPGIDGWSLGWRPNPLAHGPAALSDLISALTHPDPHRRPSPEAARAALRQLL
ncbi:serine/threonine-protein kinase [Yinghuangia sp. YIM S09857]|uniref:serine/threonine-protein kinase n=1 Tax=Yinghuangia sp. YIM S09857 TaxID=3436929 RepID=UPI003F5324FC